MAKKFRICLVILLFSFLIFTGVNAESGWDGSYDSGGSSYGGGSSSYDSSGSYYHRDHDSYNWRSSSDFKRRDRNSSSHSSNDFDAIIYAFLFTVILFYFAFENVRLKTKANKKGSKKTKEILYDLDKIKEILPNFNKDVFKYRVYAIYKKVEESFMNFDYETLQKYTTDELFHIYKSQLVDLNEKSQKHIMKDFGLKDFEIVSMETNNEIVSLTIRMLVNCMDYIVDKDNKIINGSDIQKVCYDYEMTFIKKMSKKTDKCLKCSAPLENINSNKCPYCDSVIIGENYDWVLAKKNSSTNRKKFET